MDISIELGQANDIDELEQLYNDLNDYLAKGVNYPGRIKGIYPIGQNAIDGVINGNLYVAKHLWNLLMNAVLSHELNQLGWMYMDMKDILLNVGGFLYEMACEDNPFGNHETLYEMTLGRRKEYKLKDYIMM